MTIASCLLQVIKDPTILGCVEREKRHLSQCDSCARFGEPTGCYNGWGVAFDCDMCSKTWVVCGVCPKSSLRMINLSSLKNHNKRYHSQRRARICVRRNISVDDDDDTSQWVQDQDEQESFGNSTNPTIPEISIEGIRHEQESSDNILLFDGVTDIEAKWIKCNGVTDFGHETLASQKYFHYQHLAPGMDGGMQYLVKRSLLQKDLQFTELSQINIPEGEDILMLKMAKLAFTLSSTHYQLLVDVLHGCYSLGCEDGYRTSSATINHAFNNYLADNNYQISPKRDLIASDIATRPFNQMDIKRSFEGSIPIPSSTNDFRKYFTESKHAILRNLPLPSINTSIKGHATVSIIDCIRDFLSHHCGNECLEAITPSTSHSNGVVQQCCQSLRGRQILEKSMAISLSKGIPMIAIRLDFWSDDFEPNNTKDNRQSVWLKTFTIGTVKQNGRQIRATYPLALGAKGEHDEVERCHWRELKRLSGPDMDPFYVGSKKSKIHIHFSLFTILQDQPERRSSNYLLSANSMYFNRWGVSAHLSALHPFLLACDDCHNIMQMRYENKDFSSGLPRCQQCLNWDVLSNPNTRMALTQPPKDYPLLDPEKEHNNRYLNSRSCRLVTRHSEQLLRPFSITYKGLKESVTLAWDMFQSQTWGKPQCASYLNVEGLCEKYISNFIEHANNALALTIAEQESDAVFRELELMKDAEPEKFARPRNPAVWEREGVPLTATIDAIMHLLFLGIVKSSLLMIQDWLSFQGKLASFMRVFPPLLNPLVRMSLDWVSIQPYKSDKFGGWVSENYLGFSRIMMWFFQNIDQTCPAQLENKIPPEGLPPDKWLKRHCEFWLKCRGLDKTGKVDELRARVAHYMNQPDGPPAERRQYTEDLVEVVKSCSYMLTCIMADKVTEEQVSEAHLTIRLFLQSYEKMDSSIRTDKAKPEVISKPNFCSLLNLPDSMRTYGPLRLLWEGDFCGEGYLRFMKPLLNQGVRNNWEVNTLKKALKSKSLDSVMAKQLPGRAELLTKDGLRSYSRKFHKYESQYAFLRDSNFVDVAAKVPISIILIEIAGQPCKIFGVVGDYDTLVEVTLIDGEPTHTRFGLTYWKFHASEELLNWDRDIVSTATAARIGFALLLPLLEIDNENEESRLFAMVSSNWKNLSSFTVLSDLI